MVKRSFFRIFLVLALPLFLLSKCEASLTEEDRDLLLNNFLFFGLTGVCADVARAGADNYNAQVKALPAGMCGAEAYYGNSYDEFLSRRANVFRFALQKIINDGNAANCPLTAQDIQSYVDNAANAVSAGLLPDQATYDAEVRKMFPITDQYKDFLRNTVLLTDIALTAGQIDVMSPASYSQYVQIDAAQIIGSRASAQGEATCYGGSAITAWASVYPGYVFGNQTNLSDTNPKIFFGSQCGYGSSSSGTCDFSLEQF